MKYLALVCIIGCTGSPSAPQPTPPPVSPTDCGDVVCPSCEVLTPTEPVFFTICHDPVPVEVLVRGQGVLEAQFRVESNPPFDPADPPPGSGIYYALESGTVIESSHGAPGNDNESVRVLEVRDTFGNVGWCGYTFTGDDTRSCGEL